ncbi:MAG: MATE family efflux transporter [Clostridia bacterium]|nr:MATE family efflux transporter [Clostridia bacterium]
MRRSIGRSVDITEGGIWKQMLMFFLPIMLGTFFQQLYNTVDAMVVGRFVSKEALAAVGGSAATLINLLVGFFVGLSSGATVIISQFFGARANENVSRSVHTAMALSLVGGAALMALGIVFAEPLLEMMNTPCETMADSIIYMRIYFAGIIPALIYNVGSGILRAVGDSRRPLMFLIACCALNIVLDLLFVIAFDMGVAGAAIATVLSMLISAALVTFSLTCAQYSYKLFIRKIRLDMPLLRRVLRIGMPAGVQSVMYSVSNMLIQTSINGFGTDAVAAWTTFGKIDGIFWMILSAFGIAATTFVGQNFGAGKIDRVHKSVWAAIIMSTLFAVVMSVVVHFGGGFFYSLFTDDAAVVTMGLRMMKYITPYYFTYVAIEILSGAMRGAGEALKPMILTCFGICVLRVSWVLVAVPFNPSVEMVALSYPITWVVTSVLFIIYYLRGNWLKRQIRDRSS